MKKYVSLFVLGLLACEGAQNASNYELRDFSVVSFEQKSPPYFVLYHEGDKVIYGSCDETTIGEVGRQCMNHKLGEMPYKQYLRELQAALLIVDPVYKKYQARFLAIPSSRTREAAIARKSLQDREKELAIMGRQITEALEAGANLGRFENELMALAARYPFIRRQE